MIDTVEFSDDNDSNPILQILSQVCRDHLLIAADVKRRFTVIARPGFASSAVDHFEDSRSTSWIMMDGAAGDDFFLLYFGNLLVNMDGSSLLAARWGSPTTSR